jgi:hypothetical protein
LKARSSWQPCGAAGDEHLSLVIWAEAGIQSSYRRKPVSSSMQQTLDPESGAGLTEGWIFTVKSFDPGDSDAARRRSIRPATPGSDLRIQTSGLRCMESI